MTNPVSRWPLAVPPVLARERDLQATDRSIVNGKAICVVVHRFEELAAPSGSVSEVLGEKTVDHNFDSLNDVSRGGENSVLD